MFYVCFLFVFLDQGYIRKGECYFFMKDYESAKEAYENALKMDQQNKDCLEAISELNKLLPIPNSN